MFPGRMFRHVSARAPSASCGRCVCANSSLLSCAAPGEDVSRMSVAWEPQGSDPGYPVLCLLSLIHNLWLPASQWLVTAF